MPLSEVELCSAALLKLGAAPLGSLDDPGIEALMAKRLYPIVRDSLLTSHPWGFSIAQAKLSLDPMSPSGDFAYSFLLPGDLVRTISAGAAGRGRGVVYRILGSRLQTDSNEVLLTYQRQVPTEAMPAHFTSALIARLAAEFCLPVTENSSRAEVLHRLASTEAQLARLVESHQATPRAIDDFCLVAARSS